MPYPPGPSGFDDPALHAIMRDAVGMPFDVGERVRRIGDTDEDAGVIVKLGDGEGFRSHPLVRFPDGSESVINPDYLVRCA